MAVQTASIEVISIRTGYLKWKRVLDFAFTLLISPFVLLVCLVIALCIKLI